MPVSRNVEAEPKECYEMIDTNSFRCLHSVTVCNILLHSVNQGIYIPLHSGNKYTRIKGCDRGHLNRMFRVSTGCGFESPAGQLKHSNSLSDETLNRGPV